MLMQLYNGEDAGIAPIAAVIIAAVIVRFVCARLSSRMSYLSSKAVKKTLREKIYEKLLRIGLSYKESVQTSEIVQVAVEGVDQLETYFGAYLPQFFYAMLAPLTLFVVLVRVNLLSAVVLLICVPLIPVSISSNTSDGIPSELPEITFSASIRRDCSPPDIIFVSGLSG